MTKSFVYRLLSGICSPESLENRSLRVQPRKNQTESRELLLQSEHTGLGPIRFFGRVLESGRPKLIGHIARVVSNRNICTTLVGSWDFGYTHKRVYCQAASTVFIKICSCVQEFGNVLRYCARPTHGLTVECFGSQISQDIWHLVRIHVAPSRIIRFENVSAALGPSSQVLCGVGPQLCAWPKSEAWPKSKG